MDGGRFEGRIAVVTGAASGLGRDTAIGLARQGARVVLFDRDRSGLDATAQHCGTAICIQGDVTDAASLARLAEAAAAIGPLTLLATAAGVIGATKPLTTLEEEEWDRLFDINTKGTWLTLRALLPLMLGAGRGGIVTFASAAGLTGSPSLPAYSASKAAVVMMSRSLALTHARDGIRVNCVCPGSIETPMLEEVFAVAGSAEARAAREAEFLQRHPLGRFGKPADVTAAVLFLLSDEAAFITGVALPVDGGRLA
ncbi:SDR family NAD(P)-dependent oxidoreductase [Plastoroseomonas hellenica]|uniref:SDR family NAD(P)-dependent oxidoreductase n=1 Tax=Plastoroseomonas hellenica TaxID=2687306 RepID=UPI001BAC1EAD|nr:glucose 1-dehydrogenase [Plastoroseomonas hellenica]MBR0644464.1 glucose 1-dehydrogenase [Plastoroseomonas hellenica]